MTGIMSGGAFTVESVVGIDKGRKKAKGMVIITADQPKVVSDQADAIALAENLIAGVEAAQRDEANAQRMIDSGEMDLNAIPDGTGMS